MEIKNKGTKTGLEVGLVVEMNLVETWTGGESVMEVDSHYRDGGEYVVYGSGDDGGGIWHR